MPSAFDRRVAPDAVLAFVRGCQQVVPCHLGGGLALAGVHLRHRLSRDIDLFCHDAGHVRTLTRELPRAAGGLILRVRPRTSPGPRSRPRG